MKRLIYFLVCFLLAGQTTLANEPEPKPEITVNLNIRVTNTPASCDYYKWLGFETTGKCQERGIAILRSGSIELTLWFGIQDDIEPLSLPILIRDRELYQQSNAITDLGGNIHVLSTLASTICKTVEDPDGHSLQLCP